MKNETVSRLILVLEIAAIILFHSLKSNPPTMPIIRIANDRRAEYSCYHQNIVTINGSYHQVMT